MDMPEMPKVAWTDDRSSVLNALKVLQRGATAEDIAVDAWRAARRKARVAAPTTP